jgi:hypothetical protein
VTLDVIASAAAEQADNGRMTLWNSFFPGQITAARSCPLRCPAMSWNSKDTLKCVFVGQGDVEQSRVVHVPELETVVAGDVAYNQIHLWLAPNRRRAPPGSSRSTQSRPCIRQP